MKQHKLDTLRDKFQLDITEVEPLVYKVNNTRQEVSIPELQYELEECILITSDRIRTKKKNGESILIAYVYYIILDYTRDDLKYKYHEIARDSFKDAVIDSYSKSKEELKVDSIDTVVSGDNTWD